MPNCAKLIEENTKSLSYEKTQESTLEAFHSHRIRNAMFTYLAPVLGVTFLSSAYQYREKRDRIQNGWVRLPKKFAFPCLLFVLFILCSCEVRDDSFDLDAARVNDSSINTDSKAFTNDGSFEDSHESDSDTAKPQVEDAAIQSCISPTQNLTNAYDSETYGCKCDNEDDAVCISGVALICRNGSWSAVEDGPCMPMEHECNANYREVTQCLKDYRTCIKEGDGFCAVGPSRTGCNGMVVETFGDCLMDDAFCYELSDGRYCTGPSAPSCPDNYIPMRDQHCPQDAWWCFTYSESLDCEIGELSVAECEKMDAEAVFDDGINSLLSDGCPDSRETLAYLDNSSDKPGLCCALE